MILVGKNDNTLAILKVSESSQQVYLHGIPTPVNIYKNRHIHIGYHTYQGDPRFS